MNVFHFSGIKGKLLFLLTYDFRRVRCRDRWRCPTNLWAAACPCHQWHAHHSCTHQSGTWQHPGGFPHTHLGTSTTRIVPDTSQTVIVLYLNMECRQSSTWVWPQFSVVPMTPSLSDRSVPGYSALRFQDDGRRSLLGVYQDKGNRAADRADKTSGRVDWRWG